MNLTQFTDQPNIPEFLRNVPGLTWCSRFFNYQVIMLEDLSPGSPSVRRPPLNDLPPPHLLIGYAYLFNVNNNYNFSSRTYTRIKYNRHINQTGRPRNFWALLSDCCYTLDMTGVNEILGPNLEENFRNIQNEILLNRIAADLAARDEFRGMGITLQPEAQQNVEAQERLNTIHVNNLHSYLQGPSFSYILRNHYELEKDRTTQFYINLLIKTITNFLYTFLHTTDNINLPFQENWLNQIVTMFGRRPPENNTNYYKCYISALNHNKKFKEWKKEIFGGARLRSGTRTDLNLRQRENQRAITEQMRRNRGQIIERFIDRLPLIRRIRRPIQLEEEEPEPGPSQEPEGEEDLAVEILRILQATINQLREELTEPARQHEIFNFATQFYNLYNRIDDEQRTNPEFIRRFLFYFFIMEHLSSTLYYYHTLLNLNVIFRRYVTFNYIQVIITGRDNEGRINLHRIWHNNNISPFLRIYRTILRDLLTITERTPDRVETPLDEEDLLTTLEHHPDSGDPNDIIQQARLREENVSTITVSFKINPTGLVTTTTNRTIINNASAVRGQEMRRLRAHN